MRNVIPDQWVGQTIDNCSIEQLVSRGRVSVVYHAQQFRPSRPVAFLVFHLPETIATTAQQQFRARFLHEARSLMPLRHPHLLPFHGYGEWEDWPYLIIPYKTEGSIATCIKQQGPWSPARILPLLEQVTAGLEYAHRNGQVHGMLNPANLLLNKDGSIEIAALGLQRLVERRGILPCTTPSELQSTLAGTALCAPKYLAPEYRQGHEATIRSDIYALGVLVVELLQGSFLERNILPHEILKQPDWRPPTSLQPILSRALAEDPSERFQRVSDLFTAYAEYIETREGFVEEDRPRSFPSAPIPMSSPAPHLNLEAEDQILSEEVWTDADFTQRWSPAGSSTPNSFKSLVRPLRPSSSNEVSRRRVTALLAGGLTIGIAGMGGVSLGQLFNSGGSTQTAQTAPTNSIAQTGQALNSAVAFNDTKVPEHRQRLLIHLSNGNFVAYKQGCTHAGVLVDYDPKTKLLVCPAHGAIFDPAQGGKIVKGPATTPLPQVAIKISSSGAITLA